MSESPEDPPFDLTVRGRAVAWHVRLTSDAALEADWLAFEAWLAESPDNQLAYESVESVWTDLESAPAIPSSNVLALKPRRKPQVSAWAGAIAASLVAAVALGLTLNAWPTSQTFETARGERRLIILSDGSHLTLNGGSHLSARMGWRERKVIMGDGEAVFDVAKDARRPFLIDAGERQIRVVGTEFNVLNHAGATEITVSRGVVEVRPRTQPGAPPIARLTKGQSLAHSAGGGDRVGPADPQAASAWTAGHLVFKDQPLGKVATTLNRYLARPIVVAPDALALPVTAVLTLGSDDQMLEALTTFLPVQLDRRPDRVDVRLRRGAR